MIRLLSACEWNTYDILPHASGARCTYDLGNYYDLHSGCKYSVVVGLPLAGDASGLVAAGPVEVVVPYDVNAWNPAPKSEAVAQTTTMPAHAIPTRTFSERWSENEAFCGKSIDGLRLENPPQRRNTS